MIYESVLITTVMLFYNITDARNVPANVKKIHIYIGMFRFIFSFIVAIYNILVFGFVF